MIHWSNGPIASTLTQCSMTIAISRLDGIGLGFIMRTGMDFFLFKSLKSIKSLLPNENRLLDF